MNVYLEKKTVRDGRGGQEVKAHTDRFLDDPLRLTSPLLAGKGQGQSPSKKAT